MKGGLFKLQLILVLVAIAILIVYIFIGAIGAMTTSNGCFYRYPIGDKIGNADNDKDYAMEEGVGVADAVSQTVTVHASGYYGKIDQADNANSKYGQWISSDMNVSKDVKDGTLDYTISGEVSLCKATIPKLNLMRDGNINDTTKREVVIPKIDDHKSKTPLWLIFDANKFVGEFRNIIAIDDGDKYEIYLKKDRKDSTTHHSETDIFSGKIITDIGSDNKNHNCLEGHDKYSPICGRFTIYGRNTYARFNIVVSCVKGVEPGNLLTPGYYKFDDSNTIVPGNANEGRAPVNPTSDFCNNKAVDSESFEDFQLELKKQNFQFWNSADNITGLYFRFATSQNQNNKNTQLKGAINTTFNARDATVYDNANISSTYQSLLEHAHNTKFNSLNYIKLLDQDIASNPMPPRTQIYDNNTGIRYLQYRFNDYPGSPADNSGGYVIGVKQTPCVTKNGNKFAGTLRGSTGVQGSTAQPGEVEYVIMAQGVDPNSSGNTPNLQDINALIPDKNGKGSEEIESKLTSRGLQTGTIWFRIKNDPLLYRTSTGQYDIAITTKTSTHSFFDKIISPIITYIKKGLVGTKENQYKGAAYRIFKKMTCYQQTDKSSCFQFFNYIQAMLIIYIISYAAMFLVGMVQINQTDLIIRSIKIAIVAGLMSEKTFELFHDYVFPFTTEFVDGVIANLSGYHIDPKDAVSGAAFKFLNEILTKIFFSKTFSTQMMALIGMGLNGAIYFILIFVVLIMVTIVAFRAIAVYIMAYFALAVLIGIAPLFITFILFETTRSLFENWVKFTFKYMIEPMILLAGIMILSQLFAIYLDYVIGYSVCWKCAIPIKLPFPNIPGFDPALLDIPIFCINWFMPWGVDYRSGQMGLNIQNIVALLILGYCMWGYVEFSSKLTTQICGFMSGPSATNMGNNVSSAVENQAMSSMGLDKGTRDNIKREAKDFMSEKSGKKNSGNASAQAQAPKTNVTNRK